MKDSTSCFILGAITALANAIVFIETLALISVLILCTGMIIRAIEKQATKP